MSTAKRTRGNVNAITAPDSANDPAYELKAVPPASCELAERVHNDAEWSASEPSWTWRSVSGRRWLPHGHAHQIQVFKAR